MNIISSIKTFVKEECEKPSSKYGKEVFKEHFIPMVSYAIKLAKEFEVDEEEIAIAAWLHDIGSIVYGRKDHHITGAKLAEEELKKHDYPQEKIKLIKNCIMNHRSSLEHKRASIQEQIISEADAMSNFDNIAGLFKGALVYEGKTQEEAKIAIREKLERKWKKLHFEKSKEVIRKKYEAAMILLK
jgi:uncharacterized protein